jgi:uncharacterized protein
VPRPPFVADIVALRRHPGYREQLVAQAPLVGLSVTGSRIRDDKPVRLEATLEAVEGGIVVNGTVTAEWAGECRRCLTPIAGSVTAEVEEIFVSEPEDGETYPIEGHHIDLEPMVREAAVLALPLAPLCRPDCAGLCPTCGADLNQGPCGCAPSTGDPRWAALDVLRQDPLS